MFAAIADTRFNNKDSDVDKEINHKVDCFTNSRLSTCFSKVLCITSEVESESREQSCGLRESSMDMRQHLWAAPRAKAHCRRAVLQKTSPDRHHVSEIPSVKLLNIPSASMVVRT